MLLKHAISRFIENSSLENAKTLWEYLKLETNSEDFTSYFFEIILINVKIKKRAIYLILAIYLSRISLEFVSFISIEKNFKILLQKMEQMQSTRFFPLFRNICSILPSCDQLNINLIF